MKSAFFQNMAPNAQRSFVITLVLAAIGALGYLFAVQPGEMALARAKSELAQLEDMKRAMDRDLREAPKVKERLAGLERDLAPSYSALLTPLLGSLAMRAKSILDPYAAGAGLAGMDYSELPVRRLPAPKPLPEQLHARQPIAISCRGSYADVASFILRVEKDFPHVALQALTITGQSDPEEQQAEIVLEWPVRGERTRK